MNFTTKLGIAALILAAFLLMANLASTEMKLEKAQEDITRLQKYEINTVKGEYTIIAGDTFRYVKEYYFKDGRIYYTKLDGKKGNMPADNVNPEEGIIPYEQMPQFGAFVYTEGD